MKNKGFTLAELLAVIVVLALIIGIALPTYGAVSKNIKNKTYENKKSAIAIAALKYANDANLNNSTKITATKLILDNYYEAEEYKGETPWISDPRDSSKNMACQIIDITLDNHQYYTEVEDNNDCNIAVNEIDASKFSITAYKYSGSTVGDQLSISTIDGIKTLSWTNTDVVISVTSSTTYNSISYTMTGDTVTKGTDKSIKSISKGTSLTEAQINASRNLYKVSALLYLNQKLDLTLNMSDGNNINGSVIVRIDKEKPVIASDPGSDSLAPQRKASVLVSDGNGSGIKNVTYSRTTPFSESGNATLSENKAIISNIYKNGTYTMYAYDNAGNVSDVYTLTTTKIETLKKYLDLNGSLDGVGQGNLESFGTADIYINGILKANDVTDHKVQYEYGDTYEVKDIKTKSGYAYNGDESYTGTIGSSDVSVVLPFSTGSYILSINKSGKGTVNKNSITMKYQGTENITVKPNTGQYLASKSCTTGYSASGTTGSSAVTSQTITITNNTKGNGTCTFNFSPRQFTVTLFNYTGNTKTVTATFGSHLPSVTPPTRSGYTFGGYYTEADGTGTRYYDASGNGVKDYMKTSNTTLYAKWNNSSYTLTYNNQAGSGCSSVTKAAGSTWGTLCTPTRTGYEFAGWYTGTNGTGTLITSSSIASSNLTVYAKWNTITHILFIDPNGGTWNDGTSDSKNYYVPHGALLKDYIEPLKKESHVITSWNINGINYSDNYNITEDTIATAIWSYACVEQKGSTSGINGQVSCLNGVVDHWIECCYSGREGNCNHAPISQCESYFNKREGYACDSCGSTRPY